MRSILAMFALLSFQLYANAAYIYSTFDPPGATNTQLNAVNNSGIFVGIYSAGGPYSGFMSDGFALTPLAFPGSPVTFPYGINDRGDIVGGYITTGTTGQEWRAFVRYSDGTYTSLPSLPVLGVTYVKAAGINNKGDVVGTFFSSNDSDGWGDGFLYRNGAYELFENIWPNDINDAGLIAGTQAPYIGVILSSTPTSVTFEVPDPGTSTVGLAIDAVGSVAGTYLSPDERGFVRDVDGSITFVDVPGQSRTIVSGMNDYGTVVGTYYDANSRVLRTHGFVAINNTVPEPPTNALILAAALGPALAWWRRRKAT